MSLTATVDNRVQRFGADFPGGESSWELRLTASTCAGIVHVLLDTSYDQGVYVGEGFSWSPHLFDEFHAHGLAIQVAAEVHHVRLPPASGSNRKVGRTPMEVADRCRCPPKIGPCGVNPVAWPEQSGDQTSMLAVGNPKVRPRWSPSTTTPERSWFRPSNSGHTATSPSINALRMRRLLTG